MAKAIKVENLSKVYQLGNFGTGTISRDLERFWARMRGKEDPFLKIGEVNDRAKKGESDIVWSLKDLDFEVEQGDAVGIIGQNGAGKSTLLKILSRVTSPTTGSVKIKGRIASLLEVGTGFHPELTGKENIFLNGAILGMRKAEIKRKFDEIVDFSGVERYIDTPVKRYSSGMYVRLAFAVAAYLESEILIVDEVLAVGDAEFQKKCLGKMGDVSKGEGRTVLFVSHNMGSINVLCNKGILLENGKINDSGNIAHVIETYLTVFKNEEKPAYNGDGVIKIATSNVTYGDVYNQVDLEFIISVESDILIDDLVLGILIKDVFDNPLIAINNRHYKEFVSGFRKIDKGTFSVKMDELPLLPGKYSIDLFLGNKITDIESVTNALTFNINYALHMETSFPLDTRLNKIIVNKASWKLL
jgi:lipopolysaccharide transport system ATP-binding protein